MMPRSHRIPLVFPEHPGGSKIILKYAGLDAT